MPTLCLTRRKTQLELLAQLCQERRRADIVPPATAASSDAIPARFLALESDGVLLEWPPGGVDDALVVDATITALFEHEQRSYAFRTETYGRVRWTCPRRGPVAAWKLRLPLRIDERSPRRHPRLRLRELGPVAARFTSVAEPDRRFAVRLQDLSAGGLQALVSGRPGVAVRPGELYWTQFALPGEDDVIEFVVRVAHTRVNPQDGALVFGCTFCPGDDPTPRRRQLERIERYVSRRREAGRDRPASLSGRGE